jgi:nucleotide-binding universal stress UspA family protein
MRTSSPVVVGYDGSEDAGLALRWGLDLAARTGRSARVVVVAVPPDKVPGPVRAAEQAFVHDVASRARDVVAASAAPGSVVLVEHGWTLPVLLRTAEDAAVLVIGSRGHGRLEGAWLGSVSTHLPGRAACPVAVVRPASDPGARQVLVGVDGSPASARALDAAAEHAERSGEPLLAVYAYVDRSAPRGGLGMRAEDIDVTGAQEAERFASELVAGVAVDHPDIVVRSTAVAGRPGEVLARLSRSSSLVVVGTRGRTPVLELVVGSVAQQVLNHAGCPVLVVP